MNDKPINHGKIWEEQEIDYLIKLFQTSEWGNKTEFDFVLGTRMNDLGRTKGSITSRIKKEDLDVLVEDIWFNKKWTEYELSLLQKYFDKLDYDNTNYKVVLEDLKKISNSLKRTVGTVFNKIKQEEIITDINLLEKINIEIQLENRIKNGTGVFNRKYLKHLIIYHPLDLLKSLFK